MVTTTLFAVKSWRRTILGVVISAALYLAILPAVAVRAAGGFTFSPVSGSYQVGQSFTVELRENSGTEPTNAVTAEVSYPADLLEYVSASGTGSSFTISAAQRAGSGTMEFVRGTTTPVTGDQLVQRVTFKVIGAGTATLTYLADTIAVSSDDNHSDVASARGTARFDLVEAAVDTPASSAADSQAVRSEPASTPVTTVTLEGSSMSSTFGNNDVIKVATAFTIQPYDAHPDQVSKVEYYLDGKLLSSAAVAPYSHRIDASTLINGRHQLTLKTYDKDKQLTLVNQTLLVENRFGLSQLKLQIRKYRLYIVAVLLIIGLILIYRIIHRRSRRP